MNAIDALRLEVCQANRELVARQLVTLTWGNVSGITADRRFVAIKPSGVPYERLTPHDMVVLDLDGRVVGGDLRPSVDAPTHLLLYQAFPEIGGVTHTHSPYATMFAQARREIPCFGTTHADHFAGPVPVARPLTPEEVENDYERHCGEVIRERFRDLDPVKTPGCLLAGHAPFLWGRSAMESLHNAVALEAIARMAYGTLALDARQVLEAHVIEKHHERKHGSVASYGQPDRLPRP